MANLKKYKPSSDLVVTKLKDESGEPLLNSDGTEMTITRYLPHTPEYKRIKYNQQENMLSDLEDGQEVKLSWYEMSELSIELLANTIKEWDMTWGDTDDDKPEYTPELAEEVLRTCDFLIPQLREAEDKALDFT